LIPSGPTTRTCHRDTEVAVGDSHRANLGCAITYRHLGQLIGSRDVERHFDVGFAPHSAPASSTP
jgi:hypothetical protein